MGREPQANSDEAARNAAAAGDAKGMQTATRLCQILAERGALTLAEIAPLLYAGCDEGAGRADARRCALHAAIRAIGRGWVRVSDHHYAVTAIGRAQGTGNLNRAA